MKASELRELSEGELHQRLERAREELFQLRFQKARGQLEDTNRIRAAKKDIARIMLVLSEHQRENAAV